MNIRHLPDQNRFELELPGVNEPAFISYLLSEGSEVDFDYSYVPIAMRGKGVGRQLVIHASEWAIKQKLNISASCSYVALQLRRLKLQ